ncbi:TerB family tellurite resistance protein [Pikeienuella sp. HZG-20]|uniref:tellurite resistance TerB family protein n=1 Tax=Paludibacillus litoralis TaxID=3133267 RepID=UPI0030EF985E
MSGLFERLASLFTGPEAATTAPEHDPAALAMAALMVRLARADGQFGPAERASILAALDARFGEGAALLSAAEAAEAKAIDHHQFTTLVKTAYAPEERGALLEELWRVVLADGARDDEENALMRQFGALLHVSDQDVARARQRAAR